MGGGGGVGCIHVTGPVSPCVAVGLHIRVVSVVPRVGLKGWNPAKDGEMK